jgi:hypothetical protein
MQSLITVIKNMHCLPNYKRLVTNMNSNATFVQGLD